MNVLNCLPKSAQAKAKDSLHDIWQAETKADAEKAFDLFIKMYEPKYPKASICLQKDRGEMLAFYDFPARVFGPAIRLGRLSALFATAANKKRVPVT